MFYSRTFMVSSLMFKSSLLFELSLYSLSSWRNMSGQGTERTVIFKSLTLEDTLYPLSWHTIFFFSE